jgi:hypothetical protein
MTDEVAAALLVWAVAAPLWLVFALVWSGRAMRSWYRDGLFGPYAVSSLPGFAAALTVMGLAFATEQVWLFYVSIPVFLGGIVLHVVIAVGDPVWAQPPWHRADRAARGDDYDPQGALAASFRGRREPPDHHVARFDAPAVLMTDDADRPAATTTRFGREGHLWVLPQQVQFLQGEGETAARGDVVDVSVPMDDLVDVEVLPAEPGVGNWIRMLRGDSRGRVARPRLRLAVAEASYVLHLRDPAAARDAIDACRRREPTP